MAGDADHTAGFVPTPRQYEVIDTDPDDVSLFLRDLATEAFAHYQPARGKSSSAARG